MNKSIPNHSAPGAAVLPRAGLSGGQAGKYSTRSHFDTVDSFGRYLTKTSHYSPYRKRSRIKAGHHLAAQPSTNARSAGVHMRGHENSAGAVSNVTIADI
jgi:hypothetical protein